MNLNKQETCAIPYKYMIIHNWGQQFEKQSKSHGVENGWELLQTDWKQFWQRNLYELKTTEMTEKELNKYRKQFRAKFQKRLEHIARQISPAVYAVADALGSNDPQRPQIYGEMEEFFIESLKKATKWTKKKN